MKLELGQTYICTKSINDNWWTVGKEYFVVLNCFNEPSLVDNEGDKGEAYMIKGCEIKFKLKENINELKTEITYWKDIARYHESKLKDKTEDLKYCEELACEWRDKYEKTESELQYWKETAEYNQNKLKEIKKISNKTLDN
ncbi:hypothetical protein [Enterococcus phage vB_OCPT_Ump]|nr:hypothetical protein [Enterococcus phage vB_OCPT_Ump]